LRQIQFGYVSKPHQHILPDNLFIHVLF
jgi:hypothetical protein